MENQKRPIGPQLPMHLYTCNHCFTTFGVENHQDQDHSGLVCPSCLFDTYMEDAGSGYFQMTSPPEEPMDSTERMTQQIEAAREKLEGLAALHGYNFLHSAVQQASRKLDELINQKMGSKRSQAV